MALQAPVLTGALAIIKSGTKVVGHMRNISVSEGIRRIKVMGLGTLIPQEAPAVEWTGSISCSFFELNYKIAGLEKAIRRDVGVGNISSQVAAGINTVNYEDNILLDNEGLSLSIYKKIAGALKKDPVTGFFLPDKEPYAVITRCFIESDNVKIDEASVSGRDQSFMFLDPIVYTP